MQHRGAWGVRGSCRAFCVRLGRSLASRLATMLAGDLLRSVDLFARQARFGPPVIVHARAAQEAKRLLDIGDLEDADDLAVASTGAAVGVVDVDVLKSELLADASQGAGL